MAGSVLTMDRAFGCLVGRCGVDVLDAVRLCSTTPARSLGLDGLGAIVPGARADITVLDASFRVQATWIAGRQAWPSAPGPEL
jgi:N-acetylglucosamine-6-phosphate deacetylase